MRRPLRPPSRHRSRAGTDLTVDPAGSTPRFWYNGIIIHSAGGVARSEDGLTTEECARRLWHCESRAGSTRLLELNFAIEARILGAIDFPHATRAQRSDDFIWPEHCACRKRHLSSASVQFNTREIGVFGSATYALAMIRCPSAETS